MLRRLTHSQYNHTVLDLLGDESNPADQFPPEDFVNGYKGQYQSQAIGPLLEEAYSAAAEKLARNAFRGGDTHGLIPCKPASPADATCRAQFMRGFGLRAFRRPLAEAEMARVREAVCRGGRKAARFSQGRATGGGGDAAIARLPVSRRDIRADPRWKPYEAASRLSYFLWDSMPDDALFRAAAAGELNTPARRREGGRGACWPIRKAHRSVDEFVAEWMRFDRVVTAVKDRRSVPAVHAGTGASP